MEASAKENVNVETAFNRLSTEIFHALNNVIPDEEEE